MKKEICSLSEAREKVLTYCRTCGKETVSLEASFGRVLAEDLTAGIDVPDFAKSPYDGYAFYAEDTENASRRNPVILTVTQEIPAGCVSLRKLEHGCAAHILTGAPLPEGADAIEKFESVEERPGNILLFSAYQKNQNVVPAGEDVEKGERIAFAGTRMDEAAAGMAASQGISSLEVYKTPDVAVISQGDELLEPGDVPERGKIYNSNRFLLQAALKREGIQSFYLGKIKDNPREIAKCVQTASEKYDAVIMTGGVSVGTYDFTHAALEGAGAEILADKVKIKPGSSCCLAVLNGVPVFGLSGNPTAAMTSFQLIVLPALRKMCGCSDCFPEYFKVFLAEDFRKKSPVTRILKGHLTIRDGRAFFVSNEKQQNGSVSPLKNARAYAIIPEGSGPVSAGTFVDVFLTDPM